MNETNCTNTYTYKAIGLVFLILIAWFYLSFDKHFVWPGKCAGVNLKIEKGDVVSTTNLGQDMIAVTVAFPEQKVTKVILYDYCTGKVLSNVEASK